MNLMGHENVFHDIPCNSRYLCVSLGGFFYMAKTLDINLWWAQQEL